MVGCRSWVCSGQGFLCEPTSTPRDCSDRWAPDEALTFSGGTIRQSTAGNGQKKRAPGPMDCTTTTPRRRCFRSLEPTMPWHNVPPERTHAEVGDPLFARREWRSQSAPGFPQQYPKPA
jgi:hypothetical protein